MFGTKSKIPVPIPIPTSANKPVSLKEAIGNIQKLTHIHLKISEKNVKFLSLLKEGQYWKDLPKELQKEAMGKSYGLSGGRTGFYRRLSWNKPSPTLVTHPTMPATMLIHPSEMRALSIQEYARIQQFPDSWRFAGNMIDIYKQIGNAVPVGLGYMAGKAILDHIKGMNKKTYEGEPSRYHGLSSEHFIPDFESRYVLK